MLKPLLRKVYFVLSVQITIDCFFFFFLKNCHEKSFLKIKQKDSNLKMNPTGSARICSSSNGLLHTLC